MEYMILTSDTTTGLLVSVTSAIRDGWRPQGGVSASMAVTTDRAEPDWYYHYAQAMTRARFKTVVCDDERTDD